MAQEITSWTINPEARVRFHVCLRGFRSEQSESGMGFTASILVLSYPYQINSAAYSFIRVSSAQYTYQFRATLNNTKTHRWQAVFVLQVKSPSLTKVVKNVGPSYSVTSSSIILLLRRVGQRTATLQKAKNEQVCNTFGECVKRNFLGR
jgi:hypothetical protein